MFDFVLQRLDHAARMALPFTTTLLCVLLGAAAWPVPHLGTIAPPFALMAVYYWSIHRPDLFRPWMVFVIGLLNDTIQFLPLGLSALLFVATHQIIFRQRRFFTGHSFFMLWTGFALTVVIVTGTEWLIQQILAWQLMPGMPVLIQTIMAIVLFPLSCWLLIRLQRATLAQA
jgi:rod shape-determining protein MreD